MHSSIQIRESNMSSEKKNFELDRRSLLKNILVGTGISSSGLMNTFLTNMMVNFMEKGTAQAAGADPAFEDFKFISLIAAGGIPRYYWDLPINPNGNDSIVASSMVVSKFNRDGSSVYANTKVGKYYLPHIWSGNIPTTTGVVPMQNIAKNMMIMRGIDFAIDNHELDRYRQITPIAGGASLSGLIADSASTPIPAVGRNGGGSYYSSDKGIAYLELSGTDPLTIAASPFLPSNLKIPFNTAAIDQAIDQALLKMSANSNGKSKFLPSSFASRFNARKIMAKKFGNLLTEYSTLVKKYKLLITKSFGASSGLILPGIDDMSISANGGLKQRIGEVESYSGGDIILSTDEKTYISELAEGMAIAEYMIINGLSSSVNVQSGSILNFLVQKSINYKTNSAMKTNSRTSFIMDAHYAGSDIALLVFTRYYRAVSACLNELITKLKSTPTSTGNLFDKTIIALGSDFNRIPRVGGDGSDHGWQGSNYTIFSGMINELQIVGNVKIDSGGRGTWGHAGALSEIGGRAPILGNVASTISNLLEVKTPTPNDSSFTIKEKGKAKLVITSLKNVA